MRTLSKSKILAYRQCPKRLWLEIHRPELKDDSDFETVFQIGNSVGEIARTIYDPTGTADLINVEELGYEEAFSRSATLLRQSTNPLFEAGIKADGALVFADVMLPQNINGKLEWCMIEVKSSTRIKDYHYEDIAVQSHVAISAGVNLTSVALAHIDSSFVYQGDGNYQGLLKEENITAETFSRSPEVKEWIAGAQDTVTMLDEPTIETGNQCNTPFNCPFSSYCDRDKILPDYPLSFLPRFSGAKINFMKAQGIDDLRQVPDEYLSEIQALVKKQTTMGSAYFDQAGATQDLAGYGFPAYFLDFETVMFAVPIWKTTRPYQQIPFQFSLHILQGNGSIEHRSFLDLSGKDPSRQFATTLIESCGNQGPVFVYNATFENRIMREMATRFPELEAPLLAIIDRVVDLLPIAKRRFYHPSQNGSWSIKKVLPAAIPELSYGQLEGVQDGGMAVAAYIVAIHPDTTPERKKSLKLQLVNYCQLDTFAMVKLWNKFSGYSNNQFY